MSISFETAGVAPLPPGLLDADILGLPDQLLDLLPAAVYVCNADGTIARFNRRAVELWGRAPKLGDPEERFCGSFRLHRLGGGPLPNALYPVAAVLRTGISVRDQEVMIERPDGSRVTALANIDALKDGTGTILGAVTCFQDITGLKRAEEARRTSRQKLEGEQRARALVEALPAAVYTTDAKGRITFYNEAAAEFWGHRPELGESAWCGSWRLYWPDGRPMPHDQCPMAVALKERRAISGAEAAAERPDGTRIPFLAFPTPLYDAKGKLIGAVNTLVDITERKRAERDVQRLASIVESSDDAIVSKDLNGIIRSWNEGARRLFGYAPEEVIGKPITILIPPDRHDEEPGILARLFRGERLDDYETVRQRKDGSLIDVSLRISPIRDAEGRIIGASKIARDITERKRVEERQNLLLKEMSHRVRNVFALVNGVVALSARSARAPEAIAQAVTERLSALARAHELTLPVLQGRQEQAARSTTLHDLARTILSPHADPRSVRNERIVVDGPDVPIGGSAVTGFALLLHELATNAAKYGALSVPSGRVTIAWSVEGGDVRLTWTERGGPPIDGRPASEGFGSMLAHATVRNQFGGEISRDWRPEGLTVRLSLSRERLAG